MIPSTGLSVVVLLTDVLFMSVIDTGGLPVHTVLLNRGGEGMSPRRAGGGEVEEISPRGDWRGGVGNEAAVGVLRAGRGGN